ncbi:MAG: signal peptidase II [Ferruginibacter sp.]
MTRKNKIILFIVCCVICIASDRVTKDLAKEHLKDKGMASYFHDSFRFWYVENTGAALSLGDELPKTASFWLLSMLPLAFLLLVVVYVFRHLDKMTAMRVFSIALIVSGGIGNIIDRILYDRHVTDFMNIGFGSLRTGIFNVADVWVTAGVIGLLLFYKKPAAENSTANS